MKVSHARHSDCTEQIIHPWHNGEARLKKSLVHKGQAHVLNGNWDDYSIGGVLLIMRSEPLIIPLQSLIYFFGNNGSKNLHK